MFAFAQLSESIAATTKKSEKVRLAADFFRKHTLEQASIAALFLTGRVFPRREERVLGIGGNLLVKAVLKVAGWNEVQFSDVYRRHGDLGAAADDILQAHTAPSEISLAEVATWFQSLSRDRRSDSKLKSLEGYLRQLSAVETKYFLKIATGDLRIGMKESLVEDAIAAAFEQPRASVQRANMLHGDIAQTLLLAAKGILHWAELQLFRPVAVMLASPADTAHDLVKSFPDGATVEEKYDGIRAQVHKNRDRVEFYSRTLDRILEFPELAEPVRSLSGDFILDGEILAWRDRRPLPFSMLQPRLGRIQMDLFTASAVPVSFMTFDILYRDGQSLVELPLRTRKIHLQSLLASAPAPAVQLARTRICRTAEEYEAAFKSAISNGNEGLVVKSLESPYVSGRRGRFWLKWKQPLATLDVVVTAVEYGHGKRRALLSDYTFAVREQNELLDIGKAYSGLTDAEIRDLTPYFLKIAIGHEGGRIQVQPQIVIEVAFNNLQRSGRHRGGFALRFPRIVGLRPDKAPAQIDTLDRVKEIFALQNRVATGQSWLGLYSRTG